MITIVRSVVSILVGFIVASIVMMMVEIANGNVFYPELGRSAHGVTDREVVRTLLANAPLGALLVVIGGWTLGSFAGGCTAAAIAKIAKLKHSLFLGVLLTLAGVANNLMLPPPLWFWICSLIVFLPAAYVGGRLVTPTTMTPSLNAN